MRKIIFYVVLFVMKCLLHEVEAEDNDHEHERVESRKPQNCVCIPSDQCIHHKSVTELNEAGTIDDENMPQENKVQKNNSEECAPPYVCCLLAEMLTYENKHKCGIRNPAGVNLRGRIMTDRPGETYFGEWPWQVAVLLSRGSEFLFRCGGTLIDNRHVLTVAHCVEKLLSPDLHVVARMGEWDTENQDEVYAHQDHEVSEIIIHPRYRQKMLFNDIAILKLATNVTFKPHISDVCLPEASDNFAGEVCTVTGWGIDKHINGSYSLILKEVNLPVITNAECQKMLRRTKLGRYFMLYSGFMCAGGEEGIDSCKGDGGGPLVCFKPDNYYVVAGLVSWGVGCGRPRVPGVYVSVNMYTKWIAEITGKGRQEYWSAYKEI